MQKRPEKKDFIKYKQDVSPSRAFSAKQRTVWGGKELHIGTEPTRHRCPGARYGKTGKGESRRNEGVIGLPRLQGHQCTGARYGKTSTRGSRRNEEIRLTHAQGENKKCRNWQRKYRNRQNHVRIHSTRMPRPSSRFSTSTSPLTSFTVPGTGALMPRYRYVIPPPFSVRMRQFDPFTSSTYPSPVLPYVAPGHRCLVVSVPVCNSFPPHSVLLLRKPVRAKRPVCI